MRRRAQNGRFDAGSGARGPGWVRPMASAPEVSQDSAVWRSVSPPSSYSAWHFLGVGRPPTAPSETEMYSFPMNTALTWVLRGACSVAKVETEAGRLLSSRRNRRPKKASKRAAPARRECWTRAAPRTAAETYLGPACDASGVGVARAGRAAGGRRRRAGGTCQGADGKRCNSCARANV